MPTLTSLRRPSSVISPGGRRDVEQVGRRSPRRRRAGGRPGSGGRPGPRRTPPWPPPTMSGWATQVPSKPSPASRPLSSRSFAIAVAVGLLVRAAGDERGHPAHRVGAAPVAGLHQQLGVGAHEGHGHRHRVAVGQHELGPLAEALDRAEHVVPAPGVEPGGVLAQLVEDLVHLERRRERLDQHRRLDRRRGRSRARPGRTRTRRSTAAPRGGSPSSAGRSTARCRASSSVAGVVEEVEAEVAKRRRRSARRPTSRCCSGRCQPRGRTSSVATSSPSSYSLPSSEVNSIVPAIASERLTWPPIMFSQVGELESSKSAMKPRGARVERVDHHLAVGRPGDLHPPVLEVRRRRRDPPVALAHLAGLARGSRACRPRRARARRSPRCRSSSRRRGSKRSCSSPTKASASSVRTSSKRSSQRPASISMLTLGTSSLDRHATTAPLGGRPPAPPRALAVGGDLQRAARVARDHSLGAGGQQVASLALAELGRRLGLEHVVDARRAAAQLPLRRARAARGRGSARSSSRGCERTPWACARWQASW